MISLNTIGASAETPRNEAENLLNLLTTVADPETTKKRIADLVEAASKAREEAAALTAAHAALAAAKVDKTAHDAELAADRAAFDAEVEATRKALELEKKQATDEIRRKESEATRLLNAAADHEAKARQVRENLEARLARIRDAAA
jgi:hypothetical protein